MREVKERKKKKKKRSSIEADVIRIMKKSMKPVLDKALDDIFKKLKL